MIENGIDFATSANTNPLTKRPKPFAKEINNTFS